MPVEALVAANAVLRAKRIAASRLRICFSPAHDIAHLLHSAVDHTPPADRHPWAQSSDWRGRELRRKLRTWTPQSHVDVDVHPANLRFLPPDEEIVVSGWAAGAKRDDGVSHAVSDGVSLAMLAAPLPRDGVSRVMAALVAHLATAELRGVARCLHQKRLSRNALPGSGDPTGPQPAVPGSRVRQWRGPNLRPAPYRVLPARRSLHFATA